MWHIWVQLQGGSWTIVYPGLQVRHWCSSGPEQVSQFSAQFGIQLLESGVSSHFGLHTHAPERKGGSGISICAFGWHSRHSLGEELTQVRHVWWQALSSTHCVRRPNTASLSSLYPGQHEMHVPGRVISHSQQKSGQRSANGTHGEGSTVGQ